MDLQTKNLVAQLEAAEKSLATPLRRQFYRNLRQQLIALSEIIDQQQEVIRGNTGREASPA